MEINQRERQNLSDNICQIVDSLEPGGYHTLDCLNYMKDYLDQNDDGLMNYTYKVCSESYVSRPLECYSALARELYDELFKQSMNKYQFNEWIQERLTDVLIDQNLDHFRTSDDPRDFAWLKRLWKAQDVSYGLDLGLLSTGVLYCSSLSEVELISEEACFKALMDEIQQEFLDEGR